VAVTLILFEAAFLVLSLPPPCLASTRRGAARAGTGARWKFFPFFERERVGVEEDEFVVCC